MATLTIGRHPDCDIVVNDPTVSRRHVEISQVGPDLYMAVDQNSTSGSFRFEGGSWKRFANVRLRPAERLRLGAYESTLGDLLGKARGAAAPAARPAGSTTPPRRSPDPPAPRIERDPVTGQIVVRDR